MNISSFVGVYLLSLPVFLVVDLLWIGIFANSFYDSQIGHLRGPIHWPAAIAFYLIFMLGLTYFVMYPAVTSGTVASAVLAGALFGFFTYAAYDLTNMATLKDWPLLMTLVDIAWGTVLGATVSGLTVFCYFKFFV